MKKWSIMIGLVILVSCSPSQEKQQLTEIDWKGKSEHWQVNQMKSSFSDETFTIGPVTIQHVQDVNFQTTYYFVQTHVQVNGVDHVVSAKSVSSQNNIQASPIELEEKTENYSLYSGEGFSHIKDMEAVYITIDWYDTNKGKDREERIDLYRESHQLEEL
ncbi:hypothetical protein ACFFGV_12920 [Pontibacillus salicampi]|uniref:Lipoprotein n=1 Tax=Pontibacillus salicampi TaxID=1449801 RepID=A0ABV6LPY5_9BACI